MSPDYQGLTYSEDSSDDGSELMGGELDGTVDARKDDLNGLARETLDGVDSVDEDGLNLASRASDSSNSGVLLGHELCNNISVIAQSRKR